MEKNYPIVISEGLEAITVIDNYIWGILNGSNALVKISLNTWKIEFISYIPVKNSLYTFANLFIDENKLREIKYYVKYKVRMPRRYGG